MAMLARLEDVCDILDYKRIPVTASNRVPGPYPYYGANGVQDYVADYIFDDELVLLAEDGGNFGSKDRPIAYRISGKCWVNNHAHVLKPKENLNVDYLCYSLMFYDVSNLVNGSTRQKLTQADMRGMVIPMRSMLEQVKIVSRLKTIDGLIGFHKEQLTKLEELVKSQFVGMFGDPEINPKNWPTCTLQDVLSGNASNGFFTKPEYYTPDGNAGIICVGDVVNRRYSNVQNLRRANVVDRDFERFSVRYGDILFCRSSLVKEGIAKASIVPRNCGDSVLFECHVIRVPLNVDEVIPEFLQLFTTLDFFRVQMIRKSKTSTMTTIGQKDVIGGIIFLPPMELQEQFTIFVQQIEKTEFIVQRSIDKPETLKAKLMQRYFYEVS